VRTGQEGNVETADLMEIGTEFQVDDPFEIGNLFRVVNYGIMTDKSRKMWKVEDEQCVLAMELEQHGHNLVGTRHRAFPVSLMRTIGAKISRRTNGNPPKKQPRDCGCGCGQQTKGGRFCPGHDARFHAQQKRLADDVLQVIEDAQAQEPDLPWDTLDVDSLVREVEA
jgi:hypothetical protein